MLQWLRRRQNYLILMTAMKTKILLFMCVAMTLAACTKSFEDINTNHHQLTDEELARAYQNVGAFFSQMVKSSYSKMSMSMTLS